MNYSGGLRKPHVIRREFHTFCAKRALSRFDEVPRRTSCGSVPGRQAPFVVVKETSSNNEDADRDTRDEPTRRSEIEQSDDEETFPKRNVCEVDVVHVLRLPAADLKSCESESQPDTRHEEGR